MEVGRAGGATAAGVNVELTPYAIQTVIWERMLFDGYQESIPNSPGK